MYFVLYDMLQSARIYLSREITSYIVISLQWNQTCYFYPEINFKKYNLRNCCESCVILCCSVKYDAYRQRVDSMKTAQTSGRSAPSAVKIREVEAALQLHRQRYERMQNDLVIKLKFLEENKVNWQILSYVWY